MVAVPLARGKTGSSLDEAACTARATMSLRRSAAELPGSRQSRRVSGGPTGADPVKPQRKALEHRLLLRGRAWLGKR